MEMKFKLYKRSVAKTCKNNAGCRNAKVDSHQNLLGSNTKKPKVHNIKVVGVQTQKKHLLDAIQDIFIKAATFTSSFAGPWGGYIVIDMLIYLYTRLSPNILYDTVCQPSPIPLPHVDSYPVGSQ